MTILLHIFEFALPVLYALAFVLYFRHFLDSEVGRRFHGSAVLKSALGVHAGYLTLLAVLLQHFPIATGAEFLSVLAVSIGLIYAFVEWRTDTPNTGAFFIALVFVFQLASTVVAEDIAEYPMRSRHALFAVHVLSTVLGFAALSMSAIYALMYILLARQLKSRDLGAIFRRLPPLTTLERMSRLATIAGVIVLGVGLALGHVVAAETTSTVDALDPIIIAADLIWVFYFIGLIVVKLRGLSGLRMGYLSLFGYVALIGAMLAVIAMFGTVHSF